MKPLLELIARDASSHVEFAGDDRQPDRVRSRFECFLSLPLTRDPNARPSRSTA